MSFNPRWQVSFYENGTQRYVERKDNMKIWEKTATYKPRRAVWNRFFSHSPQKKSVSQHFELKTSSLQNCETIHFCCLSHAVSDALYRSPIKLVHPIS